ncbi:hypothetical protein LTR97_004213 [Elasticomyces elasticus]|uniref:F-box domain-containing protein n=1 Tax=Elasticomyces elasticus TaxID=574655 RepID=A0AAN7ZV10_9PEZI|nr:hypothetical protein LTR97_004213 [Elasticomyces elasticus]
MNYVDNTTAASMVAEEQPSYFLELPPELRLLVYEYLVKTPTLKKMNISTARDNAPSVAILATSRLIRHEAMNVVKVAVQDFFALQNFFLETSNHQARAIYAGQELRDVSQAVAALPSFPVSRLDILYLSNGCRTSGIKAVARVSSTGVYTTTLEAVLVTGDTFQNTPFVQLETTAEELGLTLSWKKDSCHYLHISNLARSMLYFMGPGVGRY